MLKLGHKILTWLLISRATDCEQSTNNILYIIAAGVMVLLPPLGVVTRAPILARLKSSLKRPRDLFNSQARSI